MKIFGFDLKRKKPVFDEVTLRTVSGIGPQVAKIKKVNPAVLNYAQQFSGARGYFISAEYDLSEIGKIEDSVSGHRLTAVKINNKIITTTFEDLWQLIRDHTKLSISESQDKEFLEIPEGTVQVLSGKVIKNLDEEVAKERKVCRVHECNNEHVSRGMCERHRGQYRLLGYIPDKIIGSWEPCTKIIRHKVTKEGFHFLQKFGSTEVTSDHSLITQNQNGLTEFTPRENCNIARLSNVPFDSIQTLTDLDLGPYSSYQKLENSICDSNHRSRSEIPRILNPNQIMDFVALLGAFVSEGSTTNNGMRGFRIASSNKDWLKDLQSRFTRLFPKIPVNIISTGSEQFSLSCSRRIIAQLFSTLCGIDSSNKKLPDFIYQLPSEALKILNGYMLDGDGNRQKYGFSYTTKSLKLASQYSLLLRKLEINFSFNYKFKNEEIFYSIRTCKSFECYRDAKTWISPFQYTNEYVYDLVVPTTHNFIDLAGQVMLHNTDSFVRQAFKKKEGLMFKEGFEFTGANKKIIQYLKLRLKQIAWATDTPTIILLKEIARSLIRTSNAYLIKVRKSEASGGKVRFTADGKELQPIAGYFSAAPETMKIDMDEKSGKILGWRQLLPNGRYKDYRKEDVVHFTIDRRQGFLFGIPTIIPVIDDIRALRQIEENIELLLYQNLFPLFHYKVGTETAPAGWTEDGAREVDVVQQQIKYMPSEGAIVTPERHEIKAIGSEGRALRAEGYLEHFKKRVFAGLGVSQIDMGDGDTTNRATAQTLSRALIDTVKAIQDDLEAQFDQFVISELLLESTFSEDVLADENMVHLTFAEIDIQNKMEQEKHAVDLFKGYAITHDELRTRLTYEPLQIPEDPEDQDPAKYSEWQKTYWKLIEEPLKLISAVDEPYSAAAQAAAQARSTSLTQKALTADQQAREKAQEKDRQADLKAKVAIAKSKPTVKKDHFVGEEFQDLQYVTTSRIKTSLATKGTIDLDNLLSVGKLWADAVSEQLQSSMMSKIIKSFRSIAGTNVANIDTVLSLTRKEVKARSDFLINRLASDTIRLVSRRVDEQLGDVTLSEAHTDIAKEIANAFDSTRFRTDFIWDTEIRKAELYGKVLALRQVGAYGFKYRAATNACEKCQAIDGQVVEAYNADLHSVPPLHPGSRMFIEVITDPPEGG